ncbi:MAG: YncE family protein [Chthoniobacterales bacterium]
MRAFIQLMYRVIHLTTNDLVFDRSDKLIYASVPSSEFGIGNSITVIQPVKGTAGASVFVGSEPTHLAISDDGAFIYTGLYGAAAIRRFDAATRTAGLQFSLGNDSFWGPRYPGEMAVLTGQPHALAVSRFYPGFSSSGGVSIYDDGVERRNSYTGYPEADSITAGATADRLYGYNNEDTGFQFDRFNVDASGITLLDSTENLISGFGVQIPYQSGFVFATNGAVVNAEARTLAGTVTGLGRAAAVLPMCRMGRFTSLIRMTPAIPC